MGWLDSEVLLIPPPMRKVHIEHSWKLEI